MTIPLIDKIKPKNNGSFPLFDDVDGYGGLQIRLDINDRNNIPQLNRKGGMLVHTLSDGYVWELSQNLQDWKQASFSVGNNIAIDLNIPGQQKGSVLYFNGTNWVQLSPAQDGYQLTTHNVGNNPTWAPAASISILNPIDVSKGGTSIGVSAIPAREDHVHSVSTAAAISVGAANTEGTATSLARSDHAHIVNNLNIPGQTLGDIIYFNGTVWTRLAAGQDGYFLQTHSTSSAPTWAISSAVSNWYIPNWFINSSTGSDTNNGTSSGTALKTIEELCNRLCPNGETAFLKQTTTATIVGSSFGSPYFNIGAGSLIINGTVSSTANITTNSVTNTNASGNIRGEIETASGTFVDQKRIRATSGSNVGAVAWSTGLNGGPTKTFVSSFISTAGTQVNITNGDNVVVDTLAVTFNSASFLTTLNGSITITGSIFASNCYSSSNVTFNTCHFSSGTILLGGGSLQLCSFNTVSIGNGNYYGYGNQFIGICNSYFAQFNFTASNVFDDCNTFIGIDVNFNFVDLALIRRTQTTGLIFPAGSKVTSTGYLWSSTGAYAVTAVQMDPGSYFSFAILPTVSGLSNITIAGVGFSWAQLPQKVGSTSAEFNTLFTSPANDISYWTGNYWARLAAGQDGYVLTTHSITSPPTWKKFALDGYVITIPGQVQGDILYYNGINWDKLGAGVVGQALITQGVGANPIWDSNFIANNLNTTGALNVGAPITIKSTAVTPAILQATDSSSISATGQSLSLTAQIMSGFNSRGGNLTLASGTGTVASALAPDGYVQIMRGNQIVANWLTGIQPTGVNVVDDFIAFGKTPATIGTIRFTGLISPSPSQQPQAIVGRNVANTLNVPLLSWGSDVLTLGAPTNAATINASSLNLGGNSTTAIAFNINGVSCGVISSAGYNIGGTSAPATLFAFSSSTISTDGQAMNITGAQATGINSRGGSLTLGSGQGTSAQGAPDGYVIINRGSQNVGFWGTGNIVVNDTKIDDFIALGRLPATAGAIRFANGSIVQARNSGNTVNLNVLDMRNDGLIIGASGNQVSCTGGVVNILGTSITIQTAGSGQLIVANNSNFSFSTAIATPTINQLVNNAISTTAATLAITAQNSTGFNSRGGTFTLSSGQGTSGQGAPDGYFFINRGAQRVAQWQGGIGTSTTLNDDFITIAKTTLAATTGNIRLDGYSAIIARDSTNRFNRNLLLWGSDTLNVGNAAYTHNVIGNNISLISPTTNYQSMVGGIFIAESTVVPIGDPISGFYLYQNPVDHKIYIRGQSGTITPIANP